MNRQVFSLATILSLLLLLLFFFGCGGGGGDGSTPSGDSLLFYGDNTNPDTFGDGLFKIQDGVLWSLKTINPTGKSQVQGFTALGDQTVFSACNALGCEPWITDGSSNGTALLKDINPDGDSNPAAYILFDGEVYFSADDGDHGVELWKTDGTNAGTVMVKNIGIEEDLALLPPAAAISGNPQELTVFNGSLYFVANDVDFQGYGQGIELWKTDGTEVGTVIVMNIAIEDPDNPALDPDVAVGSFPHELTVFDGALYFAATDGEYGPAQYGVELWKTGGTEANTGIVKDIGIDPVNATFAYDSSPEQFTIYNNRLYFFADDGSSGFEPWKTDGAEIGTELVANVGIDVGRPFPSTSVNLTYWTEAGGRLFFTADNGISGVEPWQTDGMSTAMLADINPLGGSSVVPGRDDVFRVLDDQLFFFADDGTHGFEPWVTNGIVSGTRLVKDIYSIPINSPATADGLAFLIKFQGRLYFTANDGSSGREIWATEGTDFSTQILKDIGPGFESGYADIFGPEVLDGALWFSAFDGGVNVGHGIEMWRTLGTETETQLVEDLNPGAQYDGVLKASSFLLP